VKRIKLTIAYDGTNYSGWQMQNNAKTVEETLANALSTLLHEEVSLIGASRTDAGVHALGNVAAFDTESPIPPEKICYAVNSFLPEDIRVVKSEEVGEDFHPRFGAHNKCYEYLVSYGAFENPMERLYSYHIRKMPNIDAMKEAATYIVGEHDFESFCAAGAQVVSKVRTVYSLDVLPEESGLVIRITGNGFLYNMVRIIAGTLLKVGEGAIEPETVKDIIDAKNREKAGPTAPAKGLRLVWIEYDDKK